MGEQELAAQRDKLQREIAALERSLGPDISSIDVVLSGSSAGSEDDDSDYGDVLEEDLEADGDALEDRGHRTEMCLQMNLVYQAVIQEKLQELELLISQNKVQQEELLWELAGRRTQRVGSSKLYPLNLSIGHFFKPYFKDKVTGLGPPANPEMTERCSHIVKTFKELNCKKWRTMDNEELRKAVLSDSLQKMLQPKLLKVEYLQQKQDFAKSDIDKKIFTEQIRGVEQEIDDINQLPDAKLLGQKTDDHDWEKISNINFEGIHSADRISKMWKNHLHPDVNKDPWGEDEIKTLQKIAAKHKMVNWEVTAEELGTKRTAFQCLQQFQLSNKDFKRKDFTKEEDEMLMHFVQRMRVGMHIPYRKISYFMEGRDSMQLLHRWSKCLDPSLKKGPWSKEEDERLLKAVEKYGEKDWYKIRYEVPGRTDIQCRERYYKGLHKDIKKGKWTPEEEQKLIELTKKYGVGHWSKVGKEITHRTGSQCLSKWKNMMGYFKGKKRKRRPSEGKSPRKRPETAPKKIKEEELSEEDISDNSGDSSSSFLSSSSSSSSSSGSSGSEEEDDSSSLADDSENEERRAATNFLESMPDMDLWIPRKQNLDLPSKLVINSRASRSKMRARRGNFQFNTILKGIAYPPSTDIVTEHPAHFLSEAENSDYQIMQISEDDVRRILRQNTLLCRGKQAQQLAATQTSPASDTSEGLGSRPVPKKKKVPVDRSLLTAITPWVGNVFLPLLTHYRSPWDKQIYADAMRKQLSSVTTSSTPIFTLLMQLFQINAEGCLRMIQLRKAQEAELLKAARRTAQQPTRAAAMPPKSISALSHKAQQPQPTASEEGSKDDPRAQTEQPASRRQARSFAPTQKPKTVFELLKEKRMQQSKARRSAPNIIPSSPTIVVSPQIAVIHTSIPAGQQQTPVISVPSPTSQNAPLPASPLVSLPTCQVVATNNIASNQIPSESSDSPQGTNADKAVAVARDAGATNKCNSASSVGSPCAVQTVPGSQEMASRPVPIQLLRSAVNHAAAPTTWILTPQGLVRIPVQALFVNPYQATMNPSPAVSKSIQAVDQFSNEASNKVPEIPTILRSTMNHQLPESKGSSAQEAAQLHCAQPTKHLLPTLPSIPSPPNKTTQITITPKKYPVVKIAKILPPNHPKAVTCNIENSQRPAPSQATTTQTSTSSTEKNIFDLSLISLEDETNVKDWLQGKSGIAYLPPSATTLKTFSRILLQKKTLEQSALKLVSHSDGDGKEDDLCKKQEILDKLVEQKLKDNPAYNLLKQRFLSAFTFPGLLSVFTPPNSKPAAVKIEVKDEDQVRAVDKYVSHADNNTDRHSDGRASGSPTPANPKEGETLNPDSRWTPENVSDNTNAA